MTKQEAFQQAKFTVLTSMVNNLSTDNVSNAIAYFGAQRCEFSTIGDLERIDREIDSLISRLNCLKANVENAKQFIRDAE